MKINSPKSFTTGIAFICIVVGFLPHFITIVNNYMLPTPILPSILDLSLILLAIFLLSTGIFCTILGLLKKNEATKMLEEIKNRPQYITLTNQTSSQ